MSIYETSRKRSAVNTVKQSHQDYYATWYANSYPPEQYYEVMDPSYETLLNMCLDCLNIMKSKKLSTYTEISSKCYITHDISKKTVLKKAWNMMLPVRFLFPDDHPMQAKKNEKDELYFLIPVPLKTMDLPDWKDVEMDSIFLTTSEHEQTANTRFGGPSHPLTKSKFIHTHISVNPDSWDNEGQFHVTTQYENPEPSSRAHSALLTHAVGRAAHDCVPDKTFADSCRSFYTAQRRSSNMMLVKKYVRKNGNCRDRASNYRENVHETVADAFIHFLNEYQKLVAPTPPTPSTPKPANSFTFKDNAAAHKTKRTRTLQTLQTSSPSLPSKIVKNSKKIDGEEDELEDGEIKGGGNSKSKSKARKNNKTSPSKLSK